MTLVILYIPTSIVYANNCGKSTSLIQGSMDDYPYLTDAISRIITQLREEAGYSKNKLADLSSIDRVYLLQIEQGKYRPTLNTIFFLAEAFNMPPQTLVEMIEKERLDLKNKYCGHK